MEEKQYKDGTYLTQKGSQLIAKLLAAKGVMRYTRVAFGSGTRPEETVPKEMTALAGYVMDGRIAAVDASGNGEVSITAQIISTDVAVGFFVTEIGLYAEDPEDGEILYTYVSLQDNPEWIRPDSDLVGKLAIFDIVAAIGNVSEVTATINPYSIATKEDLDELRRRIEQVETTGAGTIASLLIPSGSWRVLEESKGDYKYQCDVEVEDSRETHYPEAALSVESLPTAEACGLCPTMLAMEGALRFWAKALPKEDMTGTYALFAHGRYTGEGGGSGYTLPAATADLLGGVKVGEGLEIAGDGRLRVVGLAEESIASDVDIRQMVEDGFKTGRENER